MECRSMHYNRPTTEVAVQCTATSEQLRNIRQCRKMTQRPRSNETLAIGVGHVPYHQHTPNCCRDSPRPLWVAHIFGEIRGAPVEKSEYIDPMQDRMLWD